MKIKTGGDCLLELQRLAGMRARKALTSGGLEPVVDGGIDGHSVFTGALLRTLRNANEPIDGFTLFTRLRRSVIVNADQTPNYGDIRMSGDEDGDFIFLPGGIAPGKLDQIARLDEGKVRGLTVEAKAAKPSRSKLDPELAFWQAIKDSQNAGDYAAFLKAYPDGALAPLAMSRYQALRDRAASPPSAPARNRAPGVVLVKVEPMDGDYVAVTKSLVRSEPGSQHGTTATLKSGDRISVTGKVPNRNWLQVSRGGQIIGYVYGVSLRPFALVEQGNVQAARRQNLQSAALAADRKRKKEQDIAYQRYLDAEARKQRQPRQRRSRR